MYFFEEIKKIYGVVKTEMVIAALFNLGSDKAFHVSERPLFFCNRIGISYKVLILLYLTPPASYIVDMMYSPFL